MAGIWSSYTSTNSSIPLLAGGLINTASYIFFPGSGIVIQTMDTTGTVNLATNNPGPESPQFPASNLILDGSAIYGQYVSNFPRAWLYKWTVSGLTFSEGFTGIPYRTNGFAHTGGSNAVVVGQDNANIPAATSNDLSTLGAVNYSNYPGYSGALGYAIFDGTNVWSVLAGSASLFKIDPSTLASTVYTLPTSVSGTSQIGFDGQYLYISTSSDVIVWDTVGLTGALAGVSLTDGGPCYYSANLGAVIVGDNVGSGVGTNFYTMPTGGGALTFIGNGNTITGSATGTTTQGMCDGPDGNDLWASLSTNFGNTCWNIVFRVSTMKIVGII